MKQVADMLDIHESTVSRSVNNKYVMTPWGLYELKHFFTSSIKQSDGESVSAVQMKERIREIIRQENKSAPLSDQKNCRVFAKGRAHDFATNRHEVSGGLEHIVDRPAEKVLSGCRVGFGQPPSSIRRAVSFLPWEAVTGSSFTLEGGIEFVYGNFYFALS